MRRASPTSRPITRCGSPACVTPEMAGIFEPVPQVLAWMDRIAAIGHGTAGSSRSTRRRRSRLPDGRRPQPIASDAPSRTSTASRSVARSRHGRELRPRADRRRADRRHPHALHAASQRRARGHRARALSAHRLRPEQDNEAADSHDQDFKGKTAVLTGAGSGFGLECARIGARARHEPGAGRRAAGRARQGPGPRRRRAGAPGARAQGRCGRRRADGSAGPSGAKQRFGAPHFVFNNAGVGAGGLVWENTVADWEWVLGVDLWGVIHGVRLFTPMMLEPRPKRPGLARPHRQHRQHGRAAHAAQHGHLQRQPSTRW